MNTRYDIKSYTKAQFQTLTEGLCHYPDCELVSNKLSSDDGHFNVYKFNSAHGRFSLHHDTKADILRIEAASLALEKLVELAHNIQGTKPSAEIIKPVKQPLDKKETPKPTEKAVKKPQKPKAEKNKKNPPKQPAEIIEPEYKDGYSLKNYALERLEGVMAALKKQSGVLVGKPIASATGTGSHLIRYAVKDAEGSKINIQYTVKSRTVQIQGKRSDLFTKAQILISSELHDLDSTVKAYIDYSKKESKKQEKPPERTGKQEEKPASPQSEKKQSVVLDKTSKSILKALKTRIPYAFDYINESEKAQLTFTMIDLDSNVRSFSGVLLPAYITLEQIISGLQRDKNIVVKMIGQAFEKDKNDKHTLKQCYLKRIDSVVFVEVVHALYIEYNKRHKFVHTNFESGAMVVMDREMAKTVFDEILNTINYNFKKLIEIGYYKKQQ